MTNLTIKDVESLEYLSANNSVESSYRCSAGYFRIRNGNIYRQYDDCHSLEDGCGDCWRLIDLGEEKVKLESDIDSD